jgi:hypothetical protein
MQKLAGVFGAVAADVPDPKSYNRLNIIDILCFLVKYVATKIIDLL